MPFQAFLTLAGTHIGLWKITEPISAFSSHFPPSCGYEAVALQRFQSEKRRKEWLAARALLHEMLDKTVRIAYTPSGKPYLENDTRSISISHTTGWVALAVSESGAVGLDIEQRSPRAFSLKEKFLTPEEQPVFPSLLPQLGATLAWSAKESCYKLCDRVDLTLKDSFSLSDFLIERDYGSCVARVTDTAERLRVLYQVYPEFVLTLATR